MDRSNNGNASRKELSSEELREIQRMKEEWKRIEKRSLEIRGQIRETLVKLRNNGFDDDVPTEAEKGRAAQKSRESLENCNHLDELLRDIL